MYWYLVWNVVCGVFRFWPERVPDGKISVGLSESALIRLSKLVYWKKNSLIMLALIGAV